MINIIKKDLIISKKTIFVIAIFSIVAPFLFYITNDDKQKYIFLYTSFFPIAFFLNRNCYQEDSYNIRLFQRTLGIKLQKIMLAKSIITLTLLLISLVISAIEQLILSGGFSMFILSVSFIITCIYASTFLFLFYVFDYSYAQLTLYAALIFIVIIVAISKINSDLLKKIRLYLLDINAFYIMLIAFIIYFLIFIFSGINVVLYKYKKKKG